MSKQWKDRTRGGLQYRIKGQDAEFKNLIRGEVYDAGLTIPLYWTEGGRIALDGESPYDLIPIEPEAPSPAKVRVDLALAAYGLRAAVENMRYAESQEDKAGEALLNAFVASGKSEVVVKIDGEHYYFSTKERRVFFRKIEVL
jgi:YHS domain-containing protein